MVSRTLLLDREEPHQVRIDEQLLSSDLHFVQCVRRYQLLQIDSSRRPALRDASLDHVPNAAAGLNEDQFTSSLL